MLSENFKNTNIFIKNIKNGGTPAKKKIMQYIKKLIDLLLSCVFKLLVKNLKDELVMESNKKTTQVCAKYTKIKRDRTPE